MVAHVPSHHTQIHHDSYSNAHRWRVRVGTQRRPLHHPAKLDQDLNLAFGLLVSVVVSWAFIPSALGFFTPLFICGMRPIGVAILAPNNPIPVLPKNAVEGECGQS